MACQSVSQRHPSSRSRTNLPTSGLTVIMKMSLYGEGERGLSRILSIKGAIRNPQQEGAGNLYDNNSRVSGQGGPAEARTRRKTNPCGTDPGSMASACGGLFRGLRRLGDTLIFLRSDKGRMYAGGGIPPGLFSDWFSLA